MYGHFGPTIYPQLAPVYPLEMPSQPPEHRFPVRLPFLGPPLGDFIRKSDRVLGKELMSGVTYSNPPDSLHASFGLRVLYHYLCQQIEGWDHDRQPIRVTRATASPSEVALTISSDRVTGCGLTDLRLQLLDAHVYSTFLSASPWALLTVEWTDHLEFSFGWHRAFPTPEAYARWMAATYLSVLLERGGAPTRRAEFRTGDPDLIFTYKRVQVDTMFPIPSGRKQLRLDEGEGFNEVCEVFYWRDFLQLLLLDKTRTPSPRLDPLLRSCL